MTQSWVNLTHYLSSLQKADQILGHLLPGTEYDPQMDPFPDHIDPGVFRVRLDIIIVDGENWEQT